MVICEVCGNNLKTISSLFRHYRETHKMKCGRAFKEHKSHKCFDCVASFDSQASLRRHVFQNHVVSERCEMLMKRRHKRNSKTSSLKEEQNIDERNDNLITDPAKLQSKKEQLLKILPENYYYQIVKCDARGRVEFKFYVSSVEECKKWITTLECENKLSLRVVAGLKSLKPTVMYNAKYRCGRNIRSEYRTKRKNPRQTFCPWRMFVYVRKIEKKDDLMIATIRFVNNHNHSTECAESLKYRKVCEEVKVKFLDLFSKGYTPSAAHQIHLEELKEKYADNFYIIQGDRFINPDKTWVYGLYYTTFRQGSQSRNNCRNVAFCTKLPRTEKEKRKLLLSVSMKEYETEDPNADMKKHIVDGGVSKSRVHCDNIPVDHKIENKLDYAETITDSESDQIQNCHEVSISNKKRYEPNFNSNSASENTYFEDVSCSVSFIKSHTLSVEKDVVEHDLPDPTVIEEYKVIELDCEDADFMYATEECYTFLGLDDVNKNGLPSHDNNSIITLTAKNQNEFLSNSTLTIDEKLDNGLTHCEPSDIFTSQSLNENSSDDISNIQF